MNINFENIKIHPIQAGTDMADNAVDMYDFVDRSDFILRDKLEYIGVRLAVVNTTYGIRGKYAVAHKFTAEVYDNTAGRVVASARFTIALSFWQEYDVARVDIPFTNADVDMQHEYTVRIVQPIRGREPRILIDKPLRFFAPSVGGNDYIEVTGGYLSANGMHLRHISEDTALNGGIDIVFEFENKKLDPARMPEMYILVEKADGLSSSKYVNCEADPATGRYRAVLPAYFSNGCIGAAYAHIRVFGHAVTGFVFHTQAPADIEGEYHGNELALVKNFNSYSYTYPPMH